MKLFISPGSCSMASHIVLLEIGEKFETEKVDLKNKTSASGDFKKINPKGYVPVLEIASGEYLTEGVVILQFLADKKPELNLVPKANSPERYRLQEWLNFISTEVHKSFSPLFNPRYDEATKAIAKENLAKRLDFLNDHLNKNQFIFGGNFTVADAYLFTVLSWADMVKLDLNKWSSIQGFMGRMRIRPSVQAALKAEGLLKAA